MTRVGAAAVAVALAVGACGGGDGEESTVSSVTPTTVATAPTSTTQATSTTSPPPTTEAAAAGRPYAVESGSRSFVDDSRITPATDRLDEQPSRTLDVWIDRPVADEPRPMVIFAHGLSGHPRDYELLRRHLAEEGFVVVAPAFPLTNHDVPDGFANAWDTAGQVADVSFLIDAVLADPVLAGAVDPTFIGVAGHSLGGVTTAGAAVAADGDDRVGAAVVISSGFGGALRSDLAVMVVHGDADDVVPHAASEAAYGALEGRRVFVTLVGGDHGLGIGDDDSAHGTALRALVAAFFADALGVDEGQVVALDDLTLDGVVDIAAGTADGPFADWRDYFA